MTHTLLSELIATSVLTIPQILFSANTGQNHHTPQDKPNVLFLFVDDMTYDGLDILGNDEIISPNLDKLISNGVRFSNAYIMGGWNGAISMPAVHSYNQAVTFGTPIRPKVRNMKRNLPMGKCGTSHETSRL